MPTRKTIALAFAGAYIIFTGFSIYANRNIPSEFLTIVSSVISYYFGRSTALDIPNQNKEEK